MIEQMQSVIASEERATCPDYIGKQSSDKKSEGDCFGNGKRAMLLFPRNDAKSNTQL